MSKQNGLASASAALCMIAAAGAASAQDTVRVDIDALFQAGNTPAALRSDLGATIDLGRRGTTLFAERVDHHAAVDADTVAGRTDAGGHFILTRDDVDVVGVVWTALGTFELSGFQGADGIAHLIATPVPGDLPECAGAIEETAAAPVSAGPRSDTSARVLMVFSQNSASGFANVEAFAANAIASANSAYSNSLISPLRVELAGVVVLDNPISLGSGPQLYGITCLHDGFADEIATLRDQLSADMVAWIGDLNDACGRAYLSPTNPNRIFSVTDPGCAIGNLSFAHELGHNFGAAHDPDNAGGAYLADAYGHRWNNNAFRSVMAYAPGSRVPYFSNPDVTYNGGATGITNQRNNARLHNTSYSIVANHRTGGALVSTDCDNDGRIDILQIAENPSLDADFDGALDSCQIAAQPSLDCNENGIIDQVETDPTRRVTVGPFLNVNPGAPVNTSFPVGAELAGDIEFTVGGTGDFGEGTEFVQLVVGSTNPVTLDVPLNLAGDCETTGTSSVVVSVSAAQIAADLPNVPVEVRVTAAVGSFCQYNALSVTATWTEALGSAVPCPTDCVADITGPAQDGIPDGTVDASDLTFYLDAYVAQFGTTGSADLTGPAQDGIPDGTVDASDLTFYLDTYVAEFGACD